MRRGPIRVPFRLGDEVKIGGDIHIIHEVTIIGPNDYEYSTNGGTSGHCAWHGHSECRLVQESSEESRKKLWAFVEEEEGLDDEDDE